MSVVVSCHCGRQFQAEPQIYGKQVNCPGCGSLIQIPHGPTPGLTPLNNGLTPVNPAAPGPATTSYPKPADPLQPNVYQASLSTPSQPAYQYKRRSGFPIALIIVLVIAGLFVVLVGGVAFIGYRAVATVQDVLEGTSLELEGEDFADAYRAFNTSLVSEGPSPQNYAVLTTPAGADKIHYVSLRDHQKFAAYVDPNPGDGKKHPAVLFLHGGFAYGEEDWELAGPFREAGYVVMTPILRGENGQAGNFTLFHHEIDDVLGAVKQLKTLPYVDPSRIYITGHSAGGTLASLVAMVSSDIRAATSMCGCMDQTLNEEVAPYSTGDISEVSIRSPVAYATSFKCPIRLYLGHEEIYLHGGNTATAKRAQDIDLDVEVVIVAGDHFTAVPEAIAKTLQFFSTEGGPASSYAPSSAFSAPNATNPGLAPPTIPTPPNFRPPTFQPPSFKPPTSQPPSFTPPNFEPPTIPRRVRPGGPSRVGPANDRSGSPF